jgi:CUB/sushi domain-containing protein
VEQSITGPAFSSLKNRNIKSLTTALWPFYSKTHILSDCGDPTPLNGSISTGVTTYLATLNVSCNIGFELVGSESITCQADSRWSEYPTCAAKGKQSVYFFYLSHLKSFF